MTPVKLLYGCGLRLFECLNLRISCFDLDEGMLTVHGGKGKKNRTVPLPESILSEIRNQFELLTDLHEKDMASGYAGAFLIGRLDKKYKNAARELSWQWVFPAFSRTTVKETQLFKQISDVEQISRDCRRVILDFPF